MSGFAHSSGRLRSHAWLGAAPGDPGIKAYQAGTHRLVAPEATLKRVRPILPVMGITRIANVTGLDRIGMPVVMVVRPNARSISVSQGKGLDLDAARTSGVMEAVEMFHAEHIDLPLRLAAYDDLRLGARVADVGGLAMPAETLFDPARLLLWIEGHDLISGRDMWVPFETVHTSYSLPLPTGSGAFIANSNGLASGNHPFEAILHGICEVIERDATTLWRLAPNPNRAIDLSSVDDATCRALLELFAAADIDVYAWNVTTDIGVAVIQCLAIGRNADTADPEFGAGCHPCRKVALVRALTEAAQARTTFIAGARDDLGPEFYSREERRRRNQDCRALIADHGSGEPFVSVPNIETATFADDVTEILSRLTDVGISQVIAVELTKPVFRIPVFRVIIPDLEGAFEDGSDYLPGKRARILLDEEIPQAAGLR